MCSLEKESLNEWCAARPEDFRRKVFLFFLIYFNIIITIILLRCNFNSFKFISSISNIYNILYYLFMKLIKSFNYFHGNKLILTT